MSTQAERDKITSGQIREGMEESLVNAIDILDKLILRHDLNAAENYFKNCITSKVNDLIKLNDWSGLPIIIEKLKS